jgi:hypothetical protein
LTARRRATNFKLGSAQSRIGACTMSPNMTWVLLMIGTIGSIYLAGRIAESRGRSFKVWAWIGAMIGPLALPLLFLFPNLHGRNGDHAERS